MEMSKEMQKKWTDKGWKIKECENGFVCEIHYPFSKTRDDLKTQFLVWFKCENKINYYYTEAKIVETNSNKFTPVLFYVEPEEHQLINETLIDLKWFGNDTKKEKKEYNLFNLGE